MYRVYIGNVPWDLSLIFSVTLRLQNQMAGRPLNKNNQWRYLSPGQAIEQRACSTQHRHLLCKSVYTLLLSIQMNSGKRGSKSMRCYVGTPRRIRFRRGPLLAWPRKIYCEGNLIGCYYSAGTKINSGVLTPPLISLWQCQSQGWKTELGDANGLCHHTHSDVKLKLHVTRSQRLFFLCLL